MRFERSCCSIALGLLLMTSAQAQSSATVAVESGALAGIEANGVRSFRGVPYAAAPVGDLRWKAPQPVTPWKDARDAREYGPACPQPDDKMYGLTPKLQSEDCLNLNIWAPVKTDKPLPVMVWLHGGANRMGASSIPFYDGSRLAQREVIVVTINYRLGYLGFFAHDALDADDKGNGAGGNFALMDQIAALKWVQKNIAAFGGDPQKVTAFGESAGGADILYLMASPAADKLFQQAIVQSGGGWNKPPKAEKFKKKIAKNLEAAGIEGTLDAAALRALKPTQLIEALAKSADIGFGPFQDGVTTTEAPSKAFAEGRAAKIPMIIGSNDWEASLLKIRRPGAMGKIMARVPPFTSWYPNRETTGEARESLMFTDIVFGAPARWLAAAHAKQSSAWLYKFEYVTSGHRGKVPGAGHAAEIAYVFDTVGITPKSAKAVSAQDQAMADALTDCWAAFAKTGKPTCALSAWDAYDPAKDNIFLIDEKPHQTEHPDKKSLDGAVDWFGPGTMLGG
ncbi:MAG: carboxylesterase family protein [Pseudomonadota bacterium]